MAGGQPWDTEFETHPGLGPRFWISDLSRRVQAFWPRGLRGAIRTIFAFTLLLAPLPRAVGAEEAFDLARHFDWQIAICYHPMYMLVDEDRGTPTLGERIPPWGAATAEQYMERVQRNLASLEKDPTLTLNYEWAAAAIEDIALRFPEVMRRMLAAHQRGQLDFVGGEYSLAHTSVHGSEANWRQFEQGLEVFQRLFGQRVTVHAHQESHLYAQLPQVLRQFGYDYLVMPSFPWAVTITGGAFQLLGDERRAYLRKGDEFLRATALDGTQLPAYFATNVRQTIPDDEYMKDLWSCPPLWIDFPDLEEYHNPTPRARTVRLGSALAERFKAAPPRAQGTIQTYYSYTEGVWAEEHLRASKAAEEGLVLLGDVLAMARQAGAPVDLQEQLNALWRQALKYQDHDVTWIEVTDLRRKAIAQFQHIAAECRKLTGQVTASLVRANTNTIAVFNGVPKPRVALIDLPPAQVPAGGGPFQKVGEKCLGFLELPAGGYRSFPLDGATAATAKECPLPEHLATEGYRVDFTPEGLIQKLTTADGQAVVTAGQYLGGEIRAVLGNRWVNNRAAACKFYDGEVGYVLERSGAFGPASPPPAPAAKPAWVQQGRIAGALKLSGDSFVESSNLGSFDQLTVALWMKPTALDYSHQALLHTAGWERGGFHFILLQDGRIQAAVNGAEPVELYSLAKPGGRLGEWTHLAVVYDAIHQRLQLFINGRKDNEAHLDRTVPVSLDKFRLGAWDAEPRFFRGELDEVRIYRGALDDPSIASLAGSATRAGTNLIAWWTMDQPEGRQIPDASGQQHPARLVLRDPGSTSRPIPWRERYVFFKRRPVIKTEVEFDFAGDELGDFHLEETKLNVYYPTSGKELWHDVPFGYESAREGEQMLALNWVHSGGLVYVNRGTPKHWARDGVLANTLGWGGKKMEQPHSLRLVDATLPKLRSPSLRHAEARIFSGPHWEIRRAGRNAGGGRTDRAGVHHCRRRRALVLPRQGSNPRHHFAGGEG